MLNRFSSRQQKLDQSFLTPRLTGALGYDRIAGYFSSSILEVAGEALESMTGSIRLVCNSQLEPRDIETAKAAEIALRREWCAAEPEKLSENGKDRFVRLHHFLKTGKLQVKILPADKFGLIHGKAGVITLANGSKTAFLGSTNETYRAWKLNYELVWEDDSATAVDWVEAEFDALWNSPAAIRLCDFVIEDIERISRRLVIPREDWKKGEENDTAAPIIEAPVYRKEYGLWEHQKFFVNLAFQAHRGPHGARLLLADMVGLGKTLQLAMSAELMALYGERPVLIIVPKPLLWQWQDEMRNLLDMPSAVWNGRQWIDENGIEYPCLGPAGIQKCPRKVGIISQGLVIRRSETVEYLKDMRFECIVIDEAHKARRKNLGPGRENETPDANHLLAFLYEMSSRTKSLLLATATPVQMYPVEAWDLLNGLGYRNDFVLGNQFSKWRNARNALDLVNGISQLPDDEMEIWNWLRNPLPPGSESRDFELIRRSLQLDDAVSVATGDAWEKFKSSDRTRIRRVARDFAQNHNPFIRHIVRRTREFLENTFDKETKESYLRPVKVELLGETEAEAIRLPAYLRNAYSLAEEFCRQLSERLSGSGFLRTLLLRRVGSSIYAGRKTAENMLQTWQAINVGEEDEDEETNDAETLRTLTGNEKAILQRFIAILDANQENDPKYKVVLDCLVERRWLESGCIVFSQYYDSIEWLSKQLSADLPEEKIGIYAGGQKSGIIQQGIFTHKDREILKQMVQRWEIRLLLGTDAASEGLNLQALGTLINLDLPWNPTRL
ncbi:DEAD/DEAH box helicase family protein, partial [candidate division KSB1 bacterium]|nr:DEAD/DEAH box helicase family protein [candidate division KSB1 bacterium]